MFPGSLNKKGLQPPEFENTLRRKIVLLFESEGQASNESLPPRVKRSIKTVKEKVCLRENITNADGLDQRRKADALYEEEGILLNRHDSPSKVQNDSGGAQGSTSFTKRTGKEYHENQIKLFKILNANGKLATSSYSWPDHHKGWLFHIAEGRRATPAEMCNVLDEVTKTYIRDFINSDKTKAAARKYGQEKREPLREVFDPCKLVLMGRIAGDWAVENDLMKERDYERWKEHVCVIMSFAALLVLMESIARYQFKIIGTTSLFS
jgi:hypothetical protein